MDERIGKYLSVRELPLLAGRKTKTWEVVGSSVLGVISWYGPWRQYTVDFAPATTFNNQCLRDIAAFLDKANRQQRESRPDPEGGGKK